MGSKGGLYGKTILTQTLEDKPNSNVISLIEQVVRYIALQSCSMYTVNGQSWPMGDKDGFATSDRFPYKSNLA